ncbi:MAG: hypothetical protein U0163_13575 [Gemmatimonadaceae bacterium]
MRTLSVEHYSAARVMQADTTMRPYRVRRCSRRLGSGQRLFLVFRHDAHGAKEPLFAVSTATLVPVR